MPEDFDYTGRFLQPGRLYKFRNTFFVGWNADQYNEKKGFEFEEDEILLYVEQWNDHKGIYHKFLKQNGQVANVDDHWITHLIKYMKRINE